MMSDLAKPIRAKPTGISFTARGPNSDSALLSTFAPPFFPSRPNHNRIIFAKVATMNANSYSHKPTKTTMERHKETVANLEYLARHADLIFAQESRTPMSSSLYDTLLHKTHKVYSNPRRDLETPVPLTPDHRPPTIL